MRKLFGSVLIVLLLFFVSFIKSDDLLVQIKNGKLRGTYMDSKDGRKILAFVGIPYAKPPVRALRFLPPQPHDDWTEVRNATEMHDVCPQRNIYSRSTVIEGVEDCLFLNVYTPKTDENKLLPVMIFIHGGGFLAGGGNTEWFGPDLLLDQDVVLVVPNYRLGALGFLTTGDEVVPGNNGLKDQTMVLTWIQENIKQFGGDPNSVTIFGESAGGAAAHFHMLSPLSKGLIHGAISQSGTALNPWAFNHANDGVETSKKLARLLDCPTDDNRKMVECLRRIDTDTFIAQDVQFQIWDTDPMIPFKPTAEPKLPGAFLDENPIDIIKSGVIANNVPWINGITTDDGCLRAAALYGTTNLIQELNDDFVKKVQVSLLFHESGKNPDQIAEQLRKYYFGEKDIDLETRQSVIDLYTDGWFLNGADQANYLHKIYLNHPIYYYSFGHRGNFSMSTIFGDPDRDYGVCHADDLQYLFSHHGPSPIEKGSVDYDVMKLFTTLWANFAKNGKPNLESVEGPTNIWDPVVSSDKMEYLFMGSNGHLTMEKGLYYERAKFWRNLPVNPRLLKATKDEL